jgi:hypothetical protein|tara:strand:- start:956 stop:1195 length:240 start_codon:yes stop_codon:yes gene_type:complete
MKKRIHINQHKIRSNKKNNTKEPVITVKTSKSNDYAHEVKIEGPSKVIYSPDKPLPCGARVWIETEEKVVLDNGLCLEK